MLYILLTLAYHIKDWHTLGLFSSSDFWSSGNLLNLRSKIHLCSCLSSMKKFLRVRLTIQHLLPQVILMRKAPPSSSPTTWWKFSCSSSLKHACQTDKSLMRHVNWQNRSIKYSYKTSIACCVQLRISQTPSKLSVYYSSVKLLSSDQYIENLKKIRKRKGFYCKIYADIDLWLTYCCTNAL